MKQTTEDADDTEIGLRRGSFRCSSVFRSVSSVLILLHTAKHSIAVLRLFIINELERRFHTVDGR